MVGECGNTTLVETLNWGWKKTFKTLLHCGTIENIAPKELANHSFIVWLTLNLIDQSNIWPTLDQMQSVHLIVSVGESKFRSVVVLLPVETELGFIGWFSFYFQTSIIFSGNQPTFSVETHSDGNRSFAENVPEWKWNYKEKLPSKLDPCSKRTKANYIKAVVAREVMA